MATTASPLMGTGNSVTGKPEMTSAREQQSGLEAEHSQAEGKAPHPGESPQHLFTLSKETGEVHLLGKDPQGKTGLPNPSSPRKAEAPVFEIIPHKGFLGNFIINFKNNYGTSDSLEGLAAPVSKSPGTAAREIKERWPEVKADLTKGGKPLEGKTGTSGMTDPTERAFVYLPDDKQQQLLEKLPHDPEGNNSFVLKGKKDRWQYPEEDTGKLTWRQNLSNMALLIKGEDGSPKTTLRQDFRNMVSFVKNDEVGSSEIDEGLPKAAQPSYDKTLDMQKTKFNPEDINWKDAEKLGLTKDLLEKTDNLTKLLNGEKTSLLQGLKGDLGGVKVSLDGKFRLAEDPSGKPTFVFHGVRAHLDVPRTYLGYAFSPEDRQNLKEGGNLNKQVTLTDRSTNKEFQAYIGVDRDTQELVAVRADRIKIPNTLKGVLLTDEQKKSLEQGKPTPIAGMKDEKNQEFSATVQIDPAKKGFSFRPLPATAVHQILQPEHKIQVAANNEGNKAETVKHTDSVKSKQQQEPEPKAAKRRGPKL
ncbi:DUF3945 domain-containing protein [Rufibacter sp. XAAS-G3-1]|uniref:DUF3945 domain-containing protein n=1 Tax=Rufibacter sp. XAAS-G3-1 TaxID=2729134 RepID=UPI0015E63CDC|nr:DUF3945 domain-containing protein [Rufibacter sp. XAAS-G3-1]